jgi:hypothetical protein
LTVGTGVSRGEGDGAAHLTVAARPSHPARLGGSQREWVLSFLCGVDFDSKYVDVGEGWAASKMKIVPRSGISLPRALSLKKKHYLFYYFFLTLQNFILHIL